jgi:hypothetical protein
MRFSSSTMTPYSRLSWSGPLAVSMGALPLLL